MTPRFLKLLKTRLTFSRRPAIAARSFPLNSLVGAENASAPRVPANIVREFEQRAGNAAPHRQKARGGQCLVSLSQARRQDAGKMPVNIHGIVLGAVLKCLPGDVLKSRIAQSDGRCRPRLVIDARARR